MVFSVLVLGEIFSDTCPFNVSDVLQAFLYFSPLHLYFCSSSLAKHLCRFLTKLLTEDLPKLFVRPKKIVLDFQKGKAVGPVPKDPKSGESQEGNSNFAGELSVTLLDARKLNYVFYGMNSTHSNSNWNELMLLLSCNC